MSESKEYFKVILIGEINVGKTSIITQLLKHEFDTIDFSSFCSQYIPKNLEIVEGKFITFDIWNTIGQKEKKALSETFIKIWRLLS